MFYNVTQEDLFQQNDFRVGRNILSDISTNWTAETMRLIFSLYLELKSIPKLATRLAMLGIVSRTMAYGGKTIGGQPFRTGALCHLISNRVYVGDVKHHDQHFPV